MRAGFCFVARLFHKSDWRSDRRVSITSPRVRARSNPPRVLLGRRSDGRLKSRLASRVGCPPAVPFRYLCPAVPGASRSRHDLPRGLPYARMAPWGATGRATPVQPNLHAGPRPCPTVRSDRPAPRQTWRHVTRTSERAPAPPAYSGRVRRRSGGGPGNPPGTMSDLVRPGVSLLPNDAESGGFGPVARSRGLSLLTKRPDRAILWSSA